MSTCKQHANESVVYCWECLEEARDEAWSRGAGEAFRTSRRDLKAVLMALRAKGIYDVTVNRAEGYRALRGDLVVHVDEAGVTHYSFVPPGEDEA